MIFKKKLDKNNPENTLVHVVFLGLFKERFECIGVLIKDKKDSIRVAFSAKNDKVIDYIDIKRINIKSIKILNSKNIKIFKR